MKKITAITVMAFLLGMGLSGCDQAKDIATEAAEKAKKDVAAEIGKAITGGEQKENGDSGKDAEKQEDEKENEGDRQ